MEYVEGETLAERLKRQGTLGEEELKAILLPLLDGLAQVHAAGLLHRDIKPANIMLREADGSPVLVDFGSARQATGARTRSMTAIVTPGYGPIEQYSTRGRQGPWTDLYALGGVCYRALTGNLPEEATERMRNDPHALTVKAACGKAAPAFLRAIDWALQVDEGDRPQDVAAWRAALLGKREAPKRDAPAPAKPKRMTPPEQERDRPRRWLTKLGKRYLNALNSVRDDLEEMGWGMWLPGSFLLSGCVFAYCLFLFPQQAQAVIEEFSLWIVVTLWLACSLCSYGFFGESCKKTMSAIVVTIGAGLFMGIFMGILLWLGLMRAAAPFPQLRELWYGPLENIQQVSLMVSFVVHLVILFYLVENKAIR